MRGATGLIDSATGSERDPVAGQRAMCEGRTATSNDLVFTVSVDASGNVTLDQQRAVVHPTQQPERAKTLSADNLVTLTATITDKDGDSASATAEHRPEPRLPGRRSVDQRAGDASRR